MSDAVFGAFGKIPSEGDFFRMSAPNGFVQVWDDWLQTCLVNGADTFGDRWDALYMSLPIWRFVLSPGLAGPNKVAGVLMPSIDRVGRRFPLTLMAPLTDPGPAAFDHFRLRGLFEALEDVALGVLDDGANRAGLAAQLAALTFPSVAHPAQVVTSGHTLLVQEKNGQAQAPFVLASRYIAQSYAHPSVWGTVIGEDARLMVCEGLPEGANMRGLFDLDADVWKAGQT
jgi:type VI secretion system protein ImpM